MAKGNFVSEWFGHRVYPGIVSTIESIADQQQARCPFLSRATNEARPCIKSEAAKGVCTISSVSNGDRQDWLACPYRALNEKLVADSIRLLFKLAESTVSFVIPAVRLAQQETREDVLRRLADNQPVFIYFDEKTGGELSIPPTDRSPEFSFDVTIVELIKHDAVAHVGRFGILEIQTMDFHGSYRAAVRNLTEALRMHPTAFGTSLQANQWWLGEGVEGPNIANVFKRTFYQMMFKFQLGRHAGCAGCVLAIPKAVWDSWQRHLGAPVVTAEVDGTFRLTAAGRPPPNPPPAWIYVFEPDAASDITPSPILPRRIIGTDAPAISYWALEVAPEAALSNIDAAQGFLAALSRRLKVFWPELAKTITVTVGPTDTKARRHEGRAAHLEKQSKYSGPSDQSVKGKGPNDG